MGYEDDGIGFFAEWWVSDDQVGKWVDDDTVSRGLLEPLRAEGVLTNATHFWVNDGKPRAIARLDKEAGAWRDQTVQIYTGDANHPDWMFHFALNRWGVRLALGIGARFIEPHSRDVIMALVGRWANTLARSHAHLSIGTVDLQRTEAPRARPPRQGTKWKLGALDYYLGQTWHGRDPTCKGVLTAIGAAPLPDGATRVVEGDVVHVAFAADLAAVAAVAAARTKSEEWLTPLVPTSPARGWNEQGDRLVVPRERRTDVPPFTFFDPDSRIGYKGLIVDPDSGEVDEAVWAELAAIAATGRLPDGTQVASVRLVVPVRANALQLHERAKADGFEAVAYPAGGVFWRVDPC